MRDYRRGTCTATRLSQASPKRAEHTLVSAQDLEAFKTDMTSMLSDMLQSSLSKFASQFNPSSGGQGDLAEYIDDYPGMPEGARAVMLLLKLDIISCLNYAWREAHNKMLLRRSIALDCLRRTLPPIDDQKLALLHAPFKSTCLQQCRTPTFLGSCLQFRSNEP